ncbi:DUF6933 domain-containing protein [Chlamydiota bacterium]
MILHCTVKLFKEMGIDKNNIPEKENTKKNSIDSWYAHLFFINRTKNVIFTNEETLYTFVASNVKKEDIRNLSDVFQKELGRALYYEDFRSEEIGSVLSRCRNIFYSKTANRGVLGSINDFILNYKSQLKLVENAPSAIYNINRTLMGYLDYDYPIVKFHELIKNTIN